MCTSCRDSDEDWEAGMEEAGGVEAATDALEELQRAATAATAATQQQGSQPGVSEPRYNSSCMLTLVRGHFELDDCA